MGWAQYRVTAGSHSSRTIALFSRCDSQPIRRSFFGEKSLPEACIALLFWVFRTGPPRSSWAGISSTLPGTAGKSSTQIGRKIGAICRSAQETRRMVDLAASRHFSMEASMGIPIIRLSERWDWVVGGTKFDLGTRTSRRPELGSCYSSQGTHVGGLWLAAPERWHRQRG